MTKSPQTPSNEANENIELCPYGDPRCLIDIGGKPCKRCASVKPSPTKPDIELELKRIVYEAKCCGVTGLDSGWTEVYEPQLLKNIQTLITKKQLEELNFILDNASGGGSWRRVIIGRISELTKKGKA